MPKLNAEVIFAAKAQLAIEYNCCKDDFSGSENIVTTAVNPPNKRHYYEGESFFKMVTFGQNAVVSADEAIHKGISEFIKDQAGYRLFERENLEQLEDLLRPYGKKLTSTFHMFLPMVQTAVPENKAETKWLEQEEISSFYNGSFPNALCTQFDPKRPDVLAIAAYENNETPRSKTAGYQDYDTALRGEGFNNEVIAMAGCSADTDLLWQIGIDVFPGHRGLGLGTYLVSALKDEIIRRGKIPFYGTSLSNLHSWNIAINCGFRPMWVEIDSKG